MDNLEFLDSGQPENAETHPVETPVAEAPAEAAAEQAEQPPEGETAEQKATRERDERGRFKAREEQPVMVPLQALHETRDEVKALKAELEKLRQPTQQEVQQTPDVFEDPQGYSAYLQNQITQATLNERLNLSEEMARQSAGNEAVNAAQEWGKQQLASNPAFAQSFYAQRNPYGFLVNEYKRSQTLAQLGNADPKEVEAFLTWKAAQTQPGEQPNPEPQATPPKSIASAVSAGGLQAIPTGPTAAFDQVFPR